MTTRSRDERAPSYAVVVPTLGRPSLPRLLASLAAQDGPRPVLVVLVDDRAAADAGAPLGPVAPVDADLVVLRGGGRGPAAARNLGWRQVPPEVEWVAFLDDDVELPPGWAAALRSDLAAAGPRVAGVQGGIRVPLPVDRRPTDWERGTAGLERAWWATADMAYRRGALASVGGFDERFTRAYREDADLALRVRRAGGELVRGTRHVVHPVRPASRWTSVRAQRGNADDVLMRRLHGARWRAAAGCPRGRLGAHALAVASAGVALGAAAVTAARTVSRAASRPGGSGGAGRGVRPDGRAGAVAIGAGLAWVALTAELAAARISPGPRTRDEVATMLLTTPVLAPSAVGHRLRGAWRHRRSRPWAPVEAVLFDRDGTLVADVPYNGDPRRVVPLEDAVEAVQRVRERGIAVGVVSNQSGIARGLLDPPAVEAVNAEMEAQLGPFATWQWCPHGPADRCSCRKPAPGLVLRAAAALGVDPRRCVVVGDTGADVAAAQAAGSRAVLVPRPVTRTSEVRSAPVVAASLLAAVDLVLGGAL